MGTHDGHRERKRTQFLEHGLDSFADHEVLELLLFYAIPRKDTNGIAHALMEGVTDLACALPRHTVVPYRNMAKHLYPTNIPQEATHEITRR